MATVKIVYNPNKSYYQPKAKIVYKFPEVKQPTSQKANTTLKIPKYVELP